MRGNKHNPNAEIETVVGHSQGGAIAGVFGMRYLRAEERERLNLFTFGGAASPSYGWAHQRHVMSLYDPVPHLSGKGLLFFPLTLIESMNPEFDVDVITRDQRGRGIWYHSWDPTYEKR